MMRKTVIRAAIGVAFSLCWAVGAHAATCPAYTYTFSNGTTSDATQVNSNFNTILNCANNNLAPLASPSFTGSVGIGTATPSYALDVAGGARVISGASSGLVGWDNSSHTLFALTRQTNDLSIQSFAGIGFAPAITTGVGSTAYAMFITSGKVGIGTTTPAQALEVNGQVKVDTFASASATTVCQNANVLSTCSSSIRYKENVKDAPFGLNEVMKMRPVTFKWKGRDEHDLGFIAEEMEKIDPLFVTYKDNKVEGVKYPQLTAVLANAVKELKAANDNQAREIVSLKDQLNELRKDVAFVKRSMELSPGGQKSASNQTVGKCGRGTLCARQASHS